ncbi:hypothetical protein BKA61DRAFT_711773 [Leptodontidium sp. MPI-SDFR-AT-0119]|nr:hypothetical protein BKA61DRAFT_711773 [Leptodontidium sp. MPI-SDFR-AT-0119]
MALSLTDLPEVFKLMPTSSILLALLALCGVLFAVYRRLLPQPIPGIPYDRKSAQRLLGDAPDMLREVYKFQAPLCQVFVQPWLLLADSVEARDIMMRRPEFDRSNFITDGLSPLDGFHARMKTGLVWKTTRTWLQDLIGPTFLNNIAGPRIYQNMLHLVDFWQTKARLANGRPFDVNEDLNHSAFDGMLSILFDENFKHTALGPQIQAVSQLDPSSVETGLNGEAKFPEGQLNEFIAGIYETVDAIDKVTKSMSPTFAMWWLRQTPRFKKIIAIKNQVVREQTQAALERLLATGKTETAIEYMLMREKKAAEKQGQKANYEIQLCWRRLLISGTCVVRSRTSKLSCGTRCKRLTLPRMQKGVPRADPKASYGIVHRADQCCLRLRSREESHGSV